MTRGFFSFGTLALALALFTLSCGDDEDPITIDSSQPNGSFTVERSGTLTAQSGTPTTGTVELGRDRDNVDFLRLGNDFTTELATGTVTVYFSTSEQFLADPGNGNPDLILIGAIRDNGEQFYRLDQPVPAEFSHVILWCNTASIPFGNAEL